MRGVYLHVVYDKRIKKKIDYNMGIYYSRARDFTNLYIFFSKVAFSKFDSMRISYIRRTTEKRKFTLNVLLNSCDLAYF